MAEPPRTHKLATRVVLSGALAGAIAGAMAALSAVLAVDHMIARRAEQRVAGAADVLAGELDEGFEEDTWEPLAEIVDDENGELITSGIRLAVYSGTHRIAGDRWAPYVPAGTCATQGQLGARVIACGRAYRDWVLVAAAKSDERALRTIYIISGLGSLLVGALIAALAALRLSRWALSPLHELSAAIRTLEPDGSAQASLGPPSDCEEVELIRAALADLHARVQGLLDHARRFSADAAHELRTPLATIRAELDLLREDAEGQPEQAALSRIAARVQQLAALVERLLALSSTIGPREVQLEAVALADVASEVIDALPAPERARVELRAGTEGLVRGDESLLRSLVTNAIDNALKFSSQPVTVAIDEQEEQGAPWVRLTTRDRGPGVPAELRARVFEPFFRAAPGATPGHGLGLAMIGHIARAHGGRAELVELPAGEAGACLAVVLPAWRPAKPNET